MLFQKKKVNQFIKILILKQEKDLCIHICFILLKKFKLVRTDERTWQLGLNEREINQIIRGDAAQDSQAKKAALKVQ